MSLEHCIKQFKANPNDLQTGQALFQLLTKSQYFVLFQSSTSQNFTKSQVEKLVKIGQVEKLPILTFHTHLNKEPIFPVFTSLQELSLFPESFSYLALQVSFESLYFLIKTHPYIQTVLLNPEGDALAFERTQFLKSFSFIFGTLESSELSSSYLTKLEQGRGKLNNQTLKNLIKMAQRFLEIKKIWILKESQENGKEGKLSWLLVIESEKENQEAHADLLRLLLPEIGKVGICYTSYSPIQEVLKSFHPVYIRPYRSIFKK